MPSEIEQLTQLAFMARYIERIADYATNIAELVIYEVNGQYFDLNLLKTARRGGTCTPLFILRNIYRLKKITPS